MADMFVDNPYLMVNGVDYSSKVRSVKLSYGREPIETTSGGDGTRVSMPGLKSWRLEVTLKDDYVSSGLDQALFALSDAGTAFSVRVRPVNTAIGTSNPEWVTTNLAANASAAGAMIDGPYDLLSGSVGSLAEKTIAFIPAGGTQTKLTRSTAAIT